VESGGAGQNQRNTRNYLLKPMVQVRLGLYSIILGVLFAAGTLGVLYAALDRTTTLLLGLIDEKAEATRIISQQFEQTAIYLVVLSVVFVVSTVSVSILYTHRLVGPTYAFRRHLRALRDGRYEVRTLLRKNDAFTEVADDLNQLAEELQRGAKPGA
jgi:methyl-accepting chemotaxis protein